MEFVYLLCSIISSSLISLALSLLLPFRRLFPAGAESVSLYQGTVWHERRRPVHHSFRYSARYALFDLDHAPPGHLSSDEARSIARTRGPVFLLTIPPSVGYEQNPLSVYYCYDLEGSTRNLKKCIAEVTNTPWGEKVSFLFNPNSDLVAKALHVSPFMDMLGSWKIKANAPGDSIFIMISVHHPELGDFFTASLTAKKISSSGKDQAFFFWLMPHKVAIWIYWHAFKLWWKGVPFVQHPRYSDPGYRQEALVRDCKLQCMPSQENDVDCVNSEEMNRCFRWRDAKWPWS